MSDDNGAVETTVAEVATPTTPDLHTLYAAVANGGGKWRLVTVRRDHGQNYEQVVKYFSAADCPVRLFNAKGLLAAGEVTVRVLQSSLTAQGVKYVGEIDPVLYEGPKL